MIARSQLRSPRGLTLVEVLITIGLVATVLLPLLGMMALAIDAQREANEESIAMMISQGIYADLRKSSGDIGILIRTSSNYPEVSNDPDADYTKVNSSSTQYVAYGMDPNWASYSGSGNDLDRGAKPLRLSSAGEYSTGAASGDSTNGVLSTHLVAIAMEPGTLSTNGVVDPGITKVTVSVEVPAVAGAADRRKYTFSSFMSLTDRFN